MEKQYFQSRLLVLASMRKEFAALVDMVHQKARSAHYDEATVYAEKVAKLGHEICTMETELNHWHQAMFAADLKAAMVKE